MEIVDNNNNSAKGSKKNKNKEDFTERVDQEITKQKGNTNFDNAIENLLALEKQTRQAEDEVNTKKLACAIVARSYEKKDFKALTNNLILLSKRRGQLRPVIQGIVDLSVTYLDALEGETKMDLIKTLLEICAGKIYVEIQRARLTLILAHIREKEGKINEAADLLQEIQIETFGQMDKKEKTEFLLEQIRLTLAKKDIIKTQIITNKVNQKMLDGEGFEALKLRFYTLMIQYHSFENKYLEIAKCYLKIYQTPNIKEDIAKYAPHLQLACIYTCLAPFDNEQSDLINRISSDTNLKKDQLVHYDALLKAFLTKELIRWNSFQKAYQPILNKHKEMSAQLWEDLKARFIEHNIRVVAAYYSRIRMQRLSKLLELDEQTLETKISELIVNGTIFARIDRPTGIINFNKPKDPNDLLNEWAYDISSLLNLIEQTSHLIDRETMVHQKRGK